MRAMMGDREAQRAPSGATQLLKRSMGEPLDRRKQHSIARRRAASHPDG
jgi:hypothetical protein